MNLDWLSENISVRWQWYEPNGSLYTTYDLAPIESGSFEPPYEWYRIWGYIGIQGNSAEDKCGIWRVEVFIKNPWGNWGQPRYTDHFQILETPNIPPAGNLVISPAVPEEGQTISLYANATDNTYLGSSGEFESGEVFGQAPWA